MMAMSNTMPDPREPGDVEALLPWYAAGTLNARDARRVADALDRDPALARQYAVILEEYASTIELNESLGAPSSRAMQKLFAAIDAEPARAPGAGQGSARALPVSLPGCRRRRWHGRRRSPALRFCYRPD